MKKRFTKFAVVAALGLAISFIFSCSSDSDSGRNNPTSVLEISSSGGDGDNFSSGNLSSSDVSSSSFNNSESSSSSNNGNNGSSLSVQCPVSGFEGDEFIDVRDCKRYKYEANDYNGRVWMVENLNYSRNGTLGWCYKTGTGTNKLGTAGEDLEGCDRPYGRHYTYDIAIDGTTGQGLCPDGWVIPSVAEWQGVSGSYIQIMPDTFYVRAGYYYTEAGDPLASIWKDRRTYGYYWARNIPFGNSAGFALVNWTSIDVRSPGAPNAAKTSDYFSVRCIMDQYFTPTCGGKPLDFATQRCVGGVVVNICTASDNTSTHYCSNGTLKQYGSMTDGVQTYKTVEIGTQTWMAENLNYNATNSKCCGDNTGGDGEGNCAQYGRLYDWETAKTVCPSGWHLPSNEEWTTLTNSVGGSSTAGTKLKAINGWNGGGNGTNDYGFSALPGGYGTSNGYFRSVGDNGYWWSSTESYASRAYNRIMYYNYASVGSGFDKSYFFSVRCVQDEA